MSQLKSAVRCLSDQLVGILVILVEIIGQIRHADKSFHRILQLHKEAPLRHAGDHTLELLADVLLHILYLLELDRLAFRLIRTALHLARMFRHFRQNMLIMVDPLLIQPAAQTLLDNAVDLQIRITPDW